MAKFINPKTGKEEQFSSERKRIFENTYKVKLQRKAKPPVETQKKDN